MTKENVKRLFASYQKNGNKEALADLVKKRPWLVVKEEPKPKAKPKTKEVVKDGLGNG